MEDLSIDGTRVIPAEELVESFARSSGPGGQNVNKTESKVVIRWKPAASRFTASLSEDERARMLHALAPRLTKDGDVIAGSSDARSQAINRTVARERLAEIVRRALVRVAPRRATKPSRASRRRRVEAKRHASRKKQDRRRTDD